MNLKRGFSLVELLVVLVIITIITSIIIVSLTESRAKARDAIRKDDIQRIGYAIDLWHQEKGRDPICENGTRIETGITALSGTPCVERVEFLNYIENILGGIPTDPFGPAHSDYFYYYDGRHACDDVNGGPSTVATIVFAVNLETEESNALNFCQTREGGDGGFLSTANINPSEPYMVLLKRE